MAEIAAVSVVAILPLWCVLALEWPASVDFVFYATLLKHFSAQVWSGDLYPRWLLNVNGGLGSAASLFYSPLSFYVGSLFEWLAPYDPHGFGRVLLDVTLALFVGGLTSHRWLRRHLPEQAAARGALLYSAFPFLLLTTYIWSGIAHVWAVALFPLLLNAADDIAARGSSAVPTLAIAYALLAVAHLPSTVVFALVPCAYAMFMAAPGNRLSSAFLALFAGLLGAGLSAIYWLPALQNQPYINDEKFLRIFRVYFFDTEMFFTNANWFFGNGMIIGLLVVIFSELPRGRRTAALTPAVIVHLAIIAAFYVMTLPLSRPLWSALPLLQYLQSPRRFFDGMIPSAVFLASTWIPQMRERNRQRWLSVVAVLMGLVLLGGFSASLNFAPSKGPIESVLAADMITPPEYRTRWEQEAGIIYSMRLPDEYAGMRPAAIVQGTGSVGVVAQTARSITVHADIKSPAATIAIRRFYFPGWIVKNRNAEIGHVDALLSLRVSQGDNEYALTVPWFAGEKEGLAITLLVSTILVAWVGINQRWRWSKPRI